MISTFLTRRETYEKKLDPLLLSQRSNLEQEQNKAQALPTLSCWPAVRMNVVSLPSCCLSRAGPACGGLRL